MGLQRVGHDWAISTFTFPPRTVLLPKDHVLFYCTTIFLVFQIENIFPFYFDIRSASPHYSQIPYQWIHPWLKFVTAKSVLVLFQSSCTHADGWDNSGHLMCPVPCWGWTRGRRAFLSQLNTANKCSCHSPFSATFSRLVWGFSWGFCYVKGLQTTVLKCVCIVLLSTRGLQSMFERKSMH